MVDTKKCNECLAGIKKNSEEIHDGIVKSVEDKMSFIDEKVDKKLASIDDKATIALANWETKGDKMTGMIKWWLGVSVTVTLFLAGGVVYIINQINTKADKADVPTMNEVRMLNELGDEYNRDVFVRKDKITGDTSAYYWSKINIYGQTLRGGGHGNVTKN